MQAVELLPAVQKTLAFFLTTVQRWLKITAHRFLKRIPNYSVEICFTSQDRKERGHGATWSQLQNLLIKLKEGQLGCALHKAASAAQVIKT